MKAHRWLIGIVLGLLLVQGCYRRPAVRGPEYAVYIFAEDEDWKILEPVFEQIFNRIVYTPQAESHFEIVHADPANMGDYLAHRQIIFAASLKSEGKVADIVKRSVSRPELLDKVKSGESFLFKKEDQWTPHQLILTLVSNTVEDLAQKMMENKDLIYQILYDFQQKMVFDYMYRTLENKELSQKLMDKYQWTVRVQHDYFLALEDSANGFVFLRRRYPERWFFVKWIEGGNPDVISKEWYFNLRDSIGVWYYGGDRVNRSYGRTKEINFLGRWCLMIEGLWENEEKVAGGPFLAYVFYDEGTDRIYAIDCAVFYPADKKLPFLDQLNAMAMTFKTKVDIQREEAENARKR